jgi:glycosyltransferase involved in cell wall biosynthesis
VNLGILIPGFSANEQDWCIPVYLNLVRCLAERDSVRVFALRYPPRRDMYRVYGATVHSMGGRSDIAGIGRLGLWARTLTAIIREHRRTPFDVLHAIWADETGLIANLAGRLLHIPTIVSIAGGELVGLPDIGYGLQLSRFSRWTVTQALRGASRVIAPCVYTAKLAQPFTSADRLIIQPLGIDTNLFSPATPPLHFVERGEGGEAHLLAVGSLSTVKDHAAAIRVFSRLRTSGVTLTIVGDGPLRSDLQRLAESLGMADRVHFQGAVEHDQLPALYRNADLHILTSRHEAFGMVIAEAAACGVPTVGYARGILPELAAAGGGIAIAPGESAESALAEAVDALLNDRTRLAQMRGSARHFAEEQLTLSAMTDGVQKVAVAVRSA